MKEARVKRLPTVGTHLYDMPKKPGRWRCRPDRWSPGPRVGVGVLTAKISEKEFFGVTEALCVVVPRISAYVIVQRPMETSRRGRQSLGAAQAPVVPVSLGPPGPLPGPAAGARSSGEVEPLGLPG